MAMNRIAGVLFLLATMCRAQSPDGFTPASTNVWGADYARIDASGRASRVPSQIAGRHQGSDQLQGEPQARQEKPPGGFRTLTSAPLVPYYSLTVDGTDFSDPSSHSFFGASFTVRLAAALAATSHFPQAHDAVDQAMSLDPHNADALQIKKLPAARP